MTSLRERSKMLSVTVEAIRTIESFVEDYDAEIDQDKIESRLKRLDILYDRFVDTSIAVELLMEDKSETKAILVKDRNEMEERYYTLHDFLTTHKPNHHVSANSPQISTSVVRLPKIDLPSFDGEIDNWIPFYDAYRSLIHNNKNLAAVDKFHYLMAALKYPVKKLLDTTNITGDNYKIAWDLLVSRYDNKRLLIKNHIASLFAIDPVRKESSNAILALVDQFERHVRILSTLGEQTERWSSLLVHMVCSRLNHNTLREWERSTACDKEKIPTYNELITFLKDQAGILISLNSGSPAILSPKEKSRLSVAHAAAVSKSFSPKSCIVCNQSHRIYDCEVFKRMPLEQKQDVVRKKKLCWNCVSMKHLSRDFSSQSCRKCNEKHHSLLHPLSPNDRSTYTNINSSPVNIRTTNATAGSEPVPSAQLSTPTLSTSTTTSATRQPLTNALAAAQSSNTTYSTVLLSTAVVRVHGPSGKSTFVRTLLDSCSESNFITERIVQLLSLNRQKQTTVIAGMGGATVNSTHCTVATFSSIDTTYSHTLTFSILPRITNDLPARPIDISHWKLPSEVTLADPDFAKPQKIDMVIVAQLFFSLLVEGQIQVDPMSPESQPVLQRTLLGWIVSGPVSTGTAFRDSGRVAMLCTTDDLDQQLTRFWEVENCPRNRGLSKKELCCEDHFSKTTIRDKSGRFVVRLLKKENMLSQVGDSQISAFRRFQWMQRRFIKSRELKEQYSDFMTEYIALDHMAPVITSEDTKNSNTYYLPHHSVLKPSSTTTKCRVVFDGSSKSSTGILLNECLMVGPTVQDSLYAIVIRFRMYEIALVADITKMYRRIWVHPDDRSLQRVYWQSKTDPDVRTYELTTETYGTACAPNLAIRCLQQLSHDHLRNEDDAAERIGKDFYVDDFLSGADNEDEAVQLYFDVKSILASAGFELRKWNSNSSEVLSNIPANLKDDRSIVTVDDVQGSVSTLGLLWHPESDTFRFKVPECFINAPITKRIVVSEMSKLFDPLGILGPIVITAKVFVQLLWKSKLGWDEVLPSSLCNVWENYRRGLNTLESFSIPRLVKAPGSGKTIQLHGFCDASKNTYGACIYVRSVGTNGITTTRLLTAKSIVAPIQTLSIPRLELCSAFLLSHLHENVMLNLNMNINSFFWSDSSITLHWLQNPPSHYNTFVTNRVAEVQRLTEGGIWSHVAGLENPADLISRGCDPCELINNALWWKGPPWLSSDRSEWPSMFVVPDVKQFPPEVVEATLCSLAAVTRSSGVTDCTLFTRYSSLSRLTRIVAYCRRFVHHCRIKSAGSDLQLIPHLISDELRQALISLVKVVQEEHFSNEIIILQAKDDAQLSKSPLGTLNPFIHDGLLLVGGRLNHSSYAFTRKHPMILPAGHPFTSLLIDSVHVQLLHAGPRAMIAHIRERFWPLNLRNLARRHVRSCVRCYRTRPRAEHQLMGQLPKVRITPARARIDFCGPVWLKIPLRRMKSAPPIRAYVAVFVCMATKAAHLELVGDLSAETFIAALKRFVSRRAKPIALFCDNATNFKGADKELRNLCKQLNDQQLQMKVASFCADSSIQFSFIPARAPTFGGLWEAAVKAFKHHFRRVIGIDSLSAEVMQTILCQIESCLNSRPLTALSEDPSDMEILTPGHFLVGSALQSIPEPDLAQIPENRLSLWQEMQRRTLSFWKLWSTDYITQLQQRTKHYYRQPNVLVGKLVLLKDDNLPPLRWSVGRITAVHPGADGLVRVVTIKLASGAVFDQPIVKICLLPIDDEMKSTPTSGEVTGPPDEDAAPAANPK
ncbi:uncharacterized protein LOC129766789 [Toxorhynchites rutilus septentrionalis]|uniref:uncharacterized protein LOC129766789 n=1 Tax=Toxorhynchites rutilus septentrionalis TaxID=329112 RepID=UPI00247A1ACC|nr:uncharacterized protein LOC129766789 [Toxorhynchites rutilus septentrionalis]